MGAPKINSTDSSKTASIMAAKLATEQKIGMNPVPVENYVVLEHQSGKYQFAIKDGDTFKNVSFAMPLGEMQLLFMKLKSLNRRLNTISKKFIDNKIEFKTAVALSKLFVSDFCEFHPESSGKIIDHLHIDLSNIDANNFKNSLESTCKNLNELNQQIRNSGFYPGIIKRIWLTFKSFITMIFAGKSPVLIKTTGKLSQDEDNSSIQKEIEANISIDESRIKENFDTEDTSGLGDFTIDHQQQVTTSSSVENTITSTDESKIKENSDAEDTSGLGDSTIDHQQQVTTSSSVGNTIEIKAEAVTADQKIEIDKHEKSITLDDLDAKTLNPIENNNNIETQDSTIDDLPRKDAIANNNDELFNANDTDDDDNNDEFFDANNEYIDNNDELSDASDADTDEYHNALEEQSNTDTLTSSTITDDEDNIAVEQSNDSIPQQSYNLKSLFETVKEYVNQNNIDELSQIIAQLNFEQKYNLYSNCVTEGLEDILDALIQLIDVTKDKSLVDKMLFNFVKNSKFNFFIEKLLEIDYSFAVIKHNNKSNSTFLIHAIKNGNKEITEKLINILSKEDINKQDNLGNTALIYAVALKKDHNLVKQLIEKGANIYAKNKNGIRVDKFKNIPIITDILKGAHEKNQDKIKVNLAQGNYNFITENSFEELGANFYLDVENKNNILSQIISASKRDNRDIPQNILDILIQKTNINKTKNTYGVTPLHRSIACSNYNVFSALIEADADINAKDKLGNNSLMYAAQFLKQDKNSEDIIEYLLRCNIDINAQNKSGESALIKAAKEDNALVFDMLMQKGSDVDIQDDKGYSALISAVHHGNNNMIEKLKVAKANANLKNEEGNTALMHALLTTNDNHVNHDCFAYIMTMMEQGTSDKGKETFNIKNNNGDTALILAVKSGSSYAVELLATLSVVDIDIQDSNGKTVIEIAEELASKNKTMGDIKEDAFFDKNYVRILEFLKKCKEDRKSGNTLKDNAEGLLR